MRVSFDLSFRFAPASVGVGESEKHTGAASWELFGRIGFMPWFSEYTPTGDLVWWRRNGDSDTQGQGFRTLPDEDEDDHRPEEPTSQDIERYIESRRDLDDEDEEEDQYPEEDLLERERVEMEEYNQHLGEESIHNDGNGIRIKPFIQPTFPPLEPGQKRRKDARKPKPVAGEVFFAHEALRLEDFLPEVMEKVAQLGNLQVPLNLRSEETPLMSFAAWEDCIRQVNGKVDTDLKIIVEELEQQEATPPPDSTVRSSAQAEDDSGRAKRVKKTHEKSAEEKAIEDFVHSLMNEHACEDAKCLSQHCLIADDGQSHIPLSIRALDYWASAMAANQEDVTITKPPAHHYFIRASDDVNNIAALAARRKNSSLAHSPNITINLGEALQLQQRVPLTPVQPTNTPALQPKQSLEDWQVEYGLDPEIIDLLRQNKITGPHCLKHVTDDDLKEMALVVGQRADVRDAQERWSLGIKGVIW
ncbi:hypothetical protein D9758_018227 [Tetrapyrgos nigripes]|uniref:SAM domain-containing protein n=1 Tax=Tetrapyrgos nigripes TaxID=182062 RepID=A0A8H5F710_9AGAR|nr:hypothetical protein D9758_018227 [Tetrapyrgos nigripes]